MIILFLSILLFLLIYFLISISTSYSRCFPGSSKTDFKKAIGSLYGSNLISISSNSINLLLSSKEKEEEERKRNPISSIATLYISNIHPNINDLVALKASLNEILLQTSIILHPKVGLTINREDKDSVESKSDLYIKKLRLKPLQSSNLIINGQTVGSEPSHDIYRKRDNRVGFIDVIWKNNQSKDNQEVHANNNMSSSSSCSSSNNSTNKKNNFDLKKSIEDLTIQILDRQILQGKRIKVSRPLKPKEVEEKENISD